MEFFQAMELSGFQLHDLSPVCFFLFFFSVFVIAPVSLRIVRPWPDNLHMRVRWNYRSTNHDQTKSSERGNFTTFQNIVKLRIFHIFAQRKSHPLSFPAQSPLSSSSSQKLFHKFHVVFLCDETGTFLRLHRKKAFFKNKNTKNKDFSDFSVSLSGTEFRKSLSA